MKKAFTRYSESDLYDVCVRACAVCVWCSAFPLSSGVRRVPRRSVGVLLRFAFAPPLARHHVLPLGLFALLVRAPHPLAVFLHPLGVPVANQLQELLVPHAGVRTRERGGRRRQSPGADAGAASRGRQRALLLLLAGGGGGVGVDGPVHGRLHPLARQHVQGDAQQRVNVAVLHRLADVHAGVGGSNPQEEQPVGSHHHPLVAAHLQGGRGVDIDVLVLLPKRTFN